MGFTGSVIGGIVGYESATGTGTTTKKLKKQGAQIIGMDTTAHAPIPVPPLPKPNQVAAPVDARDNQRRRRQQYFQGRNSTILTGALGIPQDANGTRKVLLGS